MTLESINSKDLLDEMVKQLHNLQVIIGLYAKVHGMDSISNSDEVKELLKNFEANFNEAINSARKTMIKYLESRPIPLIRETLNGFSDEQLRLVYEDNILKNQLSEISEAAQELLEERKNIKELNDSKRNSSDDIGGNDALGG
jgi:DNA polymerase III delta prime subunit